MISFKTSLFYCDIICDLMSLRSMNKDRRPYVMRFYTPVLIVVSLNLIASSWLYSSSISTLTYLFFKFWRY